ncbi:MAG: UDP-N-acetylmuramoyl-tripeptide--D-alanyl-D-alanine ligase [Corynebacterium sp.]|nr:UDP-N-acetylmuramoyl-tripeptide--D-alanyl-D-alanine ligase [Corynebacterium sp.]
MIKLSIGEIAAITGGTILHADPQKVLQGPIEFDSRKPATIFLALKGARVDGHDFAEQAVADGAELVICAREINGSTPIPQIIVPPVELTETNAVAFEHDPTGQMRAVVHALGLIAAANVRNVNVIGVTGSAGKTSTKDMLAAIFESMGPTVSPIGSFNNEIGLPYTATQVDEHTDYLIAELSARAIGNIADLCNIVHPRTGVVLNVGTAHVGEFGSQENIAKAKSELPAALPAEGVAILNGNDPRVAAMTSNARIVYYGIEGGVDKLEKPLDYAARNIRLDRLARPVFDLVVGEKEYPVSLKVYGLHNVSNAVAALAAAIENGAAPEAAIAALETYRPRSPHRMDVREVGGSIIIDDAFNANPSSMKAGLAAAAHIAKENNLPLVPVVGIMGELGDEAEAAYADLSPQDAIAVGVTSYKDATVVDDAEQALTLVRDRLPAVVFVKASRSAALWTVAETLVEEINVKEEG